MKLTEAARLEGVKDLPMKVRAKFAQALVSESNGDHAKAEKLLELAVKLETEQQ